MKRFWVIIIALLVLNIFCQAPPEISPPPAQSVIKPFTPYFAVGQWVKYQIRRYIKESSETESRNLSEATMKISIVGTQTVSTGGGPAFGGKEEMCYWVEYLINEGAEQQRVIKFLVDANGIPQPVKLLMKYGKLEAVEIELRRWEVRFRLTADGILREMTRSFNIIPFIKPNHSGKIEDEEIQVNLNGQETRLACQKVTLDESEEGLNGEIWYRTGFPLAGLVRAFFNEPPRPGDPPGGGGYRTSIILTAYQNTGAQSVIIETPKKLDFSE